MIIFFLILLLVVFVCSPVLRTAFLHPLKTLFYIPKDIYNYFRARSWNVAPMGKLIAITGYFGSGKTLTGAQLAQVFVKRYHGKKHFDFRRGCWVTNKCIVLSNVRITLPCGEWCYMTGLNDICNIAKDNYKLDRENNTCTLLYIVGDEFGANLNSRNFKGGNGHGANIDAEMLNVLLTCRKYNIALFYISQKFNLTDKLLRDVTQRVYWVNKFWRFVSVGEYDSDEVENSSSIKNLRALKHFYYFADDKLFSSYDTLAMVDKMETDCQNGERLSSEEILASRGVSFGGMDQITKPSRKWRKNHK